MGNEYSQAGLSVDNFRNEFELFTESERGIHTGACAKDLELEEPPTREPVPRIIVGTVPLDLKTDEGTRE